MTCSEFLSAMDLVFTNTDDCVIRHDDHPALHRRCHQPDADGFVRECDPVTWHVVAAWQTDETGRRHGHYYAFHRETGDLVEVSRYDQGRYLLDDPMPTAPVLMEEAQ